MNGFAANGMSRSSVVTRCCVRVTLPLLLSLATSGAPAWQQGLPAAKLATVSAPSEVATVPAQVELSAYSLPRFDAPDRSTQTNRLTMSWLSEPVPGRGLAMGMSMGLSSRGVPGYTVGGGDLRQSVDLGFQWRYTLDGQYRIDFTAWHRVAPADAIDLVQSHEPSYGARVEMGLGTMPKSGFVADRGFVGLQLDGGARITVRRNAGKPMFYYRTTF